MLSSRANGSLARLASLGVGVMASQSEAVDAENDRIPKLRIYSPPNAGVSPFWREKYERDARKYWDIFYKRHQDKFFKDRHYLDKEWGCYFDAKGRNVILEVGCGAGNTIFPMVASYPDIFVHACDFSPRAIDLVKDPWQKKWQKFHTGFQPVQPSSILAWDWQ